MSKITRFDWSKTAKHFSVHSQSHRKFLCQYQASQASKCSAWQSTATTTKKEISVYHFLHSIFSKVLQRA